MTYERLGATAAAPVIVLHGTPGSWRQLAGLDRPAGERGLALIVPDRAGYGGSSYDPARTNASSARDVGELIRHPGLEACRGRRAHAAWPARRDHRSLTPSSR
jgi:pimeloyl-ACP methyl ester carboxylesterase